VTAFAGSISALRRPLPGLRSLQASGVRRRGPGGPQLPVDVKTRSPVILFGMDMKMAANAFTEKTVRLLLEKHSCPVPLHEVRTRFLGNIATPNLSASPMQVIKNLWGGELPVFDSIDAANELIGALIQGLWNDLTRHQKRSQPFRLIRVPMEPTASNLGQYGLIRLQEMDGFIQGLFGGEEAIDLPQRAHQAVGHLSELRPMMASIRELVSRDPNTDDRKQLDQTFKHLRELTRIIETEIHEAVLSCTRARRQMLEGIFTEKPTIN
jgi:hypothetical protein